MDVFQEKVGGEKGEWSYISEGAPIVRDPTSSGCLPVEEGSIAWLLIPVTMMPIRKSASSPTISRACYGSTRSMYPPSSYGSPRRPVLAYTATLPPCSHLSSFHPAVFDLGRSEPIRISLRAEGRITVQGPCCQASWPPSLILLSRPRGLKPTLLLRRGDAFAPRLPFSTRHSSHYTPSLARSAPVQDPRTSECQGGKATVAYHACDICARS